MSETWKNGYGVCPRCYQYVEDHDFIDGEFRCRPNPQEKP